MSTWKGRTFDKEGAPGTRRPLARPLKRRRDSCPSSSQEEKKLDIQAIGSKYEEEDYIGCWMIVQIVSTDVMNIYDKSKIWNQIFNTMYNDEIQCRIWVLSNTHIWISHYPVLETGCSLRIYWIKNIHWMKMYGWQKWVICLKSDNQTMCRTETKAFILLRFSEKSSNPLIFFQFDLHKFPKIFIITSHEPKSYKKHSSSG